MSTDDLIDIGLDLDVYQTIDEALPPVQSVWNQVDGIVDKAVSPDLMDNHVQAIDQICRTTIDDLFFSRWKSF